MSQFEIHCHKTFKYGYDYHVHIIFVALSFIWLPWWFMVMLLFVWQLLAVAQLKFSFVIMCAEKPFHGVQWLGLSERHFFHLKSFYHLLTYLRLDKSLRRISLINISFRPPAECLLSTIRLVHGKFFFGCNCRGRCYVCHS
jgi:hypothetical protein